MLLLTKWRRVCAPHNLPHVRSFYYNSFNVKRSKRLLANFLSATKNRKERGDSFTRVKRDTSRERRKKKFKPSHSFVLVFSLGWGEGCGRYLFSGVFIREMTISLGICIPFDNNVPLSRKKHPTLNLNQ